MGWVTFTIACVFVVYAVVSKRLGASPITGPMVFVAAGCGLVVRPRYCVRLPP